ncbi:MAG TPA: lysylphosphatidylglycerol synthase domain-containing protein [Burkholderiaceae bacterium]|nr:lysylphosphatidylglycerol synthase domain-containing protein [Burkholderiaceae bacterium]
MNTRALPHGAAAGASAGRSAAPRSRWAVAKRVLTVVFLALVATLLVHHARAVEWGEVWTALRQMPARVLLAAGLLAAASHLLYSCFDLLGRNYTRHRLAAPMVMAVTFVSYAFNLNLGSLVGGVAFRYRLYSRLGLDSARITQVLSLSMLTNWFGYLLLGGLVFALRPLPLPPDWKLQGTALPVVGWALVALALAWFALCLFSTRRSFRVRGRALLLPPARMATLQLLMSCANWLLMAGVIYVLLQQQVAFPSVLAVLLLAAIAGVITHVPAGLGVLEAVFVALLWHQVPQTQLLAALLAYRAIYYLAPLLFALVLYPVLEARARHRAA